jgi:predicted small secreted protein
MTRLIALLVLAGTAMLVTGCNTMAGAGEDISHGGHALTNEAEKAK